MKCLVVEDTTSLAQHLTSHLTQASHTVDLATTLKQAFQCWELSGPLYDVVILDISLPDGEGSTFLEAIRKAHSQVGVLVLTARSHLDDKVHLLDAGADDYLTKPFELKELDARLRVLHRRGLGKLPDLQAFPPFEYDPIHRVFWFQRDQVSLRSQELKLLEAFLDTPGHVCSKASLMDRLYSLDQAVTENAVEVHMGRLRKKLKAYGVEFETLRGLGYRYAFKP